MTDKERKLLDKQIDKVRYEVYLTFGLGAGWGVSDDDNCICSKALPHATADKVMTFRRKMGHDRTIGEFRYLFDDYNNYDGIGAEQVVRVEGVIVNLITGQRIYAVRRDDEYDNTFRVCDFDFGDDGLTKGIMDIMRKIPTDALATYLRGKATLK